MKNFNAVSHNRARPYFQIQHGRGEVRARRGYLNVRSVTENVVDTELICWVLAMEMLQGVWKQHLRPRAVVGYGVKMFLPSSPNYVTRSPGDGWGDMPKNAKKCQKQWTKENIVKRRTEKKSDICFSKDFISPRRVLSLVFSWSDSVSWRSKSVCGEDTDHSMFSRWLP